MNLYLCIRQAIHGTSAVHVDCRPETLQHPWVDKVYWQKAGRSESEMLNKGQNQNS